MKTQGDLWVWYIYIYIYNIQYTIEQYKVCCRKNSLISLMSYEGNVIKPRPPLVNEHNKNNPYFITLTLNRTTSETYFLHYDFYSYMYYILPVIAEECFRIFIHSSAASFWIKTHFNETHIFHFKNSIDMHKRYTKNKGELMLSNFPNFV